MKKIIRNSEQGAVAPLVGILMVAFILCVALVVDLGHLHNVKIQLQRAVDAAALAGAQQLDGSDHATHPAAVALATADINRVAGDTDWVTGLQPSDGEEFVVELGGWDPDLSAADPRFSPVAAGAANTATAIRVEATVYVEYYFFLFGSGSTVTADAIAVANPTVPILPIALVSCIPGEESQLNAGTLPSPTVCGIRSYSFSKDKDDSAAWTSLTRSKANQPNIEFFLDPATGREEFQKVVFGKGVDDSNGLENHIVDTDRPSSGFSSSYEGCKPNPTDYLDINCGLGRIAGKDIALPNEFPAPGLLPDLQFNDPLVGDYWIGDPGFDPLTAYDTLPRWYNIIADNVFDENDHFTRIWSQDGILLPGPNEGEPAYADRLQRLLDGDDVDLHPYGDNRFADSSNSTIVPKGGDFVHKDKGKLKPNYQAVMQHAGYPKVYVNNGQMKNALKTFVENILKDPATLNCSDNDPFPADEQTVRVNMPVIFAGACEDWKALSNSDNHVLTYVGLAKFLLTRVWVNPDQYDCGDKFVTTDSDEDDCEGTSFDPELAGGDTFSLTAGLNPHIVALEGINLIPVADDEEDSGSILEVFLVE